jgi:hypothetical protein
MNEPQRLARDVYAWVCAKDGLSLRCRAIISTEHACVPCMLMMMLVTSAAK